MNIIYLSDSDKRYEDLEAALRAGEFGFLHDKTYHQYMKTEDCENQRIDRFFQTLSKESKDARRTKEVYDFYFPGELQLPTRFDAPLPYLLLKNVADVFSSSFSKNTGLNTPPFACIPLGSVNAQAVRVGEPKTEFILFNSQLLLFCHLMAKGFAAAMPKLKQKPDNKHLIANRKAVNNHLQRNPGAIRRIHEALTAYVIDGDMYKAPYYDTPKLIRRMSDVLVFEMELFVFTHETAHVLQGLLGDKFQSMNDAVVHKNELDADGMGFLLATSTLMEKGMPLRQASIGIFLFFGALMLNDRFSKFVETGVDQGFKNESSISHPSALDRIRHVAAQAEYRTSGQVAAEDIVSSLIQFLEEIWLRVMRRQQAIGRCDT